MPVRLFGAVGGALALAITLTTGASAAKVPDPCTLVSAATVSSAVGDKGAMLVGRLSTRAGGPVKQSLCT
jgi:hypothetical protein